MMTKDGKNVMMMSQRFKIASTQRRGSVAPSRTIYHGCQIGIWYPLNVK